MSETCGAIFWGTSGCTLSQGLGCMLSTTPIGQSIWWNISERVATERNIGGRLIGAVGGLVIGAVGGNGSRVLSPG